jgi:hypothetical protein
VHSGVSFEFGTRIWYSSGRLSKDLFSEPRAPNTVLNSRLTYSGLTAGTFEGFGRAELPYGSFIKGYAGFGGLSTGALSDEDFPPETVPYSDTRSDQHGGRLAYGVVDLGQTLARNARASGGLIVGLGYLNESVEAFGCAQLDGNPNICSRRSAPQSSPSPRTRNGNSSGSASRARSSSSIASSSAASSPGCRTSS